MPESLQLVLSVPELQPRSRLPAELRIMGRACPGDPALNVAFHGTR